MFFLKSPFFKSSAPIRVPLLRQKASTVSSPGPTTTSRWTKQSSEMGRRQRADEQNRIPRDGNVNHVSRSRGNSRSRNRRGGRLRSPGTKATPLSVSSTRLKRQMHILRVRIAASPNQTSQSSISESDLRVRSSSQNCSISKSSESELQHLRFRPQSQTFRDPL